LRLTDVLSSREHLPGKAPTAKLTCIEAARWVSPWLVTGIMPM
jgi:hypothetical protein